MEANLVLVPEAEDNLSGVVTPVPSGLSVGYWHTDKINGRIYITLFKDVEETIIHEVATRKAINAEIRATEKALNGVEIKPNIEYDPVTKRFKEVWPEREK